MTWLAIVLAWIVFGATFGIVWRNTTKARYSRAGAIVSGAVVGPFVFMLGLMALSSTMLVPQQKARHEPKSRPPPRRNS